MTFFTVVNKSTAGSPVARAVAMQKLKSVMNDWLIKIHMLDEGADCEFEALQAAQGFFVCLRALEFMNMRLSDASTNMRAALVCITECSCNGWKWKKSYTKTIQDGVLDLLDVYPALPMKVVARAVREEGKWGDTVAHLRTLHARQSSKRV